MSDSKRNLWSSQEVKLLGEVVIDGNSTRREVLLSKSLKSTDRTSRQAAWEAVAEEYNALAMQLPEGFTGANRTAKQLRDKWKSTRCMVKSASNAAIASSNETGAGRPGIDKGLQNFMMGLTSAEIRGIDCGEFGGGAVVVPPEQDSEELEQVPAAIQINDDEQSIRKSVPDPSPSTPTKALGTNLIRSSSSKPTPATSCRRRGSQKTKKTIEDTALLEEVKTLKLKRKKIRLQIAIYEYELNQSNIDVPPSSPSENGDSLLSTL